MQSLPVVPAGGRCACGGVLWAARGERVGEHTTFVCHRCKARFRPQMMPWTPEPSAAQR